jgi:hypothetical protein
MLPAEYLYALRTICQKLKESGIDWVLTGSASFALQGIPVEPHDIDIMTSEMGAYEIERMFLRCVTAMVAFSEAERIRSHLGRLTIGAVAVEIMGAVQTRLEDGTWEPPVDVTGYRRFVEVEGMTVPVLSLEREYQAYLRLGRTETAEILRSHIEAVYKTTGAVYQEGLTANTDSGR